MERRADRELSKLRALAIRMGALSEALLSKALGSAWECSGKIAREVSHDDLEIDRLDVMIDEAILRMLALQAPVAQDLRTVLVTKGVATDLERVGDIARNIARCAIRLTELPRVAVPVALRVLAADSQRSLRNALEAFSKTDTELARRVIAEDDRVDEGELEVMRDSLARISDTPSQVEQAISYIFIASSLERVGDHATNIAEGVVLIAEALNLKHASKLMS